MNRNRGSFYICLWSNDLEAVQEYIKGGTNVNDLVKDTYPLHICSINGYSEMCRLLLESKADPNPNSITGIHSPLAQACGHNLSRSFTDVAKMLLYAGARFDKTTMDYCLGRTLLQSKTSCRLAIGAVYLVLKKQLRCSRDITRLIMDAVWNIRFEFTKTL